MHTAPAGRQRQGSASNATRRPAAAAWRHTTAGLLTVAIGALLTFTGTAADRSTKWWWDYGGDAASSHFVAIDQINKSNVKQLEIAWYYPYGATGFNPIVVDDVMYVLGRNASSLIALDATTGKELWIHDGLTGMTNRGINYWQSADGKDRRLLFAINGYLQAIDARTGLSIATFGKNGIIDLRQGVRRAENARRFQSRTPGKVWKNLIIMGSSPGEQWMSPPGDIQAYDIVTGARVWQFKTVPEPGEYGYETWPKEAYKYSGGANTWGEMSVDEERGIVYVPTGSATYDFYGADRHGANLFANCILALDARTGKRLWHFQTVHHDLWDLDNVSAPQLVTVQHNGRRVDAVAHAGKTGLMYVFNRVTGEPLWPIEERPVPKSDVPGEQSWPTQPWPTKPEPFAKMTFSIDDVNPWLLTPEQYAATKERIAKARNDGPFTPPSLREAVSMPGNQGGSNWGTTAANPKKGLVFVVNVNQVALLKLEDVKMREGGRQGPLPGAKVFQQFCSACHGNDLRGVTGLPVPSLIGITDRLAEDAIRAVITGGKGTMRPIPGLSDSDVNALMLFLANPTGGRLFGGRNRNPGGPLPPGPVVASGGAKLPPGLPIDFDPPSYGTNGGNGGNAPYPKEVEVPPARYVSEYGVMASATKPPYTTLTAYDMNTGTIKWQIAPGDDLTTIERGGPANTGAIGGRHGMVTTSAGLVFLICGDGKLRAYDEDTGEVLWAGPLPGSSSGIPVSYEAKGRQYVVVASLPTGFRGGTDGASTPAPPPPPEEGPRGYIAFALPKR